ncbi:MAG: 4-hydroxy-3-methylbut-2-enyl diphosphate reductase [bacterium]|nr:4-hydroxy-3-methylbut-2-enyl diphosphate reductase [bacterium]
MPIILAKTAGFCMGVRRAMNLVLDAVNKDNTDIYTVGPLVHNHQAVEMLRNRKVNIIENLDNLPAGKVFIRAHGVTPEVRQRLEQPNVEVVDATCPFVRSAQLIIDKYAKQGYACIIIGDVGHPEVVGLLGYAQGNGYVVSTESDIANLPMLDKVCVVAQTTQSSDRFHRLVEKIKEKIPNAVIHNTVCSSTDERQTETLELAKQVDAMIVVGGRHSANTKRLVEIAQSTGTPTYLVETSDELNPTEIQKYHTIGITAGASTPHWVILNVVRTVKRIKRESGGVVYRATSSLFRFLIDTHLYLGLGAAALTYACGILQGFVPEWRYLLIAFFYICSMHIFNSFTDKTAKEYDQPERVLFRRRFRIPLLWFASGSALVSLGIALSLGWIPISILLVASLGGLFYSLQMIPKSLQKTVRYRSFKAIPGSKDVFMSIAWVMVTVIIPFLSQTKYRIEMDDMIAALFAFSIVFIRSIMFDLKELEGDRIIGKETLPIILGRKKTNAMINGLLILLCLLLMLSYLVKWTTFVSLVFLGTIGYIFFYRYLHKTKTIGEELLFETIVDGQFLLTGILAYVAQLSLPGYI